MHYHPAMSSGGPLSFDALLARAQALASPGRRRVLGLAGAPGAGKSTLAGRLVDRLGGLAVLVPMDGFHLAGAELERLGRSARKGAPDTFDAGGYVALLRRLRRQEEDVVYAPEFRREVEEPIAGAIAVARSAALVVTEGNYLLLDDEAWAPVRALLDEVWYVDVDDATRVDRLVRRHVAYGKAPDAARAWVLRSDEANARRVAATRGRADLVVRLGPVS